jgi:hypothetical protein
MPAVKRAADSARRLRAGSDKHDDLAVTLALVGWQMI